MKILITGANGFIAKNLIYRLKEQPTKHEFYLFDIENTKEDLWNFTKDCDFVFNFAAVHRPKENTEFEEVNHVFFDDLLNMLKTHENYCPVLYTSSIQATNGTDYGNSKLAAEGDLRDYEQQTGGRAIIYRLTNTFGRWATPNHHSVVATFCYNLVNDLPITISNPLHVMNFYYIDDVIDSFVAQLEGKMEPDDDGIFRLSTDKIYTITLGDLADTLMKIKYSIDKTGSFTPETDIENKLYRTYLSYR